MNECKNKLKRRKMLVTEINRIMITVEAFKPYWFKASKNGVVVYCVFKGNKIKCSEQIDTLGEALKLEKQGNLNDYLLMEKRTWAIRHFIDKIDNQVIHTSEQFNTDYRKIIDLVNAQLRDAVYGSNSFNNGHLTVADREIHFSEKQVDIYQCVREDRLDLVLTQLAQTVKESGAYDLTPHFKNIVTEALKETISVQLSTDKRYVNFKKRLEKVNRIITPAVTAFFTEGSFNRDPQNLKMTVTVPLETSIRLQSVDTFNINYRAGGLLSATYYVLQSKYDLEINYAEVDNLLAICAYVESMPAEVFRFAQQLADFKQAHPINCQMVLEREKASLFKNKISDVNDELPQLITFMNKEPHFEYVFNGQRDALAFTDLQDPAVYNCWIDQVANDYKKLLSQYADRVNRLASWYDNRLGNPLNYPIVTLIRDHQNQGMSTLVNILRGSGQAKILTKKFQHHPAYGTLKDLKTEAVETIIHNLVKEGLIQTQPAVIPNLGTYLGYHLNDTIRQHLDENIKPVKTVNMNMTAYLNFLKKVHKITSERLAMLSLEALTDADVDKVTTFLQTVKYDDDAEALLICQLSERMPVKWAPFFAMNSQMESGKTAKLFDQFAKALKAKMIP